MSAESQQPGVLRSAANVALSATSNLKTALGVGVTQKDTQLQHHTRTIDNTKLTTEAGVPISEDDNSLKAGERGPTLIEDFQFRDKMAHFDRERIPERVVHARGFGAHGVFELYEDQSKYTRAKVLTDTSKKTPLFIRFSTVGGFRGSADTVRDVRGFAIKFFTDEGNWDLVGNNIPVFFIQDAVKFPDLVHSIKPEPHNEIPQAQTAHDTFWDFVTLTPESAHMLMWIMSDRTIPRSFRNMNGFGVHTFRLVNAEGVAHFVKFHLRPVLGTASLVWDEAVKIQGADPDFHRRDLWQSIESGDYPEYEFGLQIVDEATAATLPFDILDSTKIIPEELVPVKYIGKITLNKNVDEFFPETEQIALHPGNIVPGIDFSEDPLLQGRLFSYTDSQFHRLGPNFQELPINRPVCPVFNNLRGGASRLAIYKGRVSYQPNTLASGCPAMNPLGYRHYPVPVSGTKTEKKPGGFADHFSQARLFYNSMTDTEKKHILNATAFELQKCSSLAIRQRVVDLYNNIDFQLASQLAFQIGSTPPAAPVQIDERGAGVKVSPSLSVIRSLPGNTIKGRKVAILVAPGFDSSALTVHAAIASAGGLPFYVSQNANPVADASGATVVPDFTVTATRSVLFDAIFVPGGAKSVQLMTEDADYVLIIAEAFKHLKTIGAANEGVQLLRKAALPGVQVAAAGDSSSAFVEDFGVVTAGSFSSGGTGATGKVASSMVGQLEGLVSKALADPTAPATGFVDAFVRSIAKHRCWDREPLAKKIVA